MEGDDVIAWSTFGIVMMSIIAAIIVGSIIWLVISEAYAAGWNASVEYHRKRDRMDPCWKTYV